MEIEISARHGQINPDTHTKITEKVSKLPRYFDRLTGVHVVADLASSDTAEVEIRVSAEHTDDFVATSSAPSVMAAVDGSLHKIEQQIRKHKEKLTGHRAKGIKHLDLPEDNE